MKYLLTYIMIVFLVGTILVGPGVRRSPSSNDVYNLQDRATQIQLSLDSTEQVYRNRILPLERIIELQNPAQAKLIAIEVHKHAIKNGIPLATAVGVLLVENPWFNPTIRSFMGATGLAQVMPFHAGEWGCGDDLEDIHTNLCTGMAILAEYMRQTSTLELALLRYNGCVRGTNTPDCHLYPAKVLRQSSVFTRLTMMD